MEQNEQVFLDFPTNQEIPNTKEAVMQKFEEAKEAVRIFRNKYPDKIQKFIFLPLNNKDTNSVINFGFITLHNMDFMMEGLMTIAKKSCKSFDPIVV